MSSAIPISTSDAVLLAAVATKLAIARTGQWHETHEHPLYQRAQHVRGQWVPLLLDELDTSTQAVDTLQHQQPDSPLVSHAEAAVHRGWTLAAAELPTTGQGASMRWTAPADVPVAVDRAFRRVRGEQGVPEPTAALEKPPKVFTRPSKRRDVSHSGREHPRSAA